MCNCIFAIQGIHNTGKTTTIQKVVSKLKEVFAHEVLFESSKKKKDIVTIIAINNSKIGICSEGDPASKMDEHLKKLCEICCDIILCACRSRGKTVGHIESMKPNYQPEYFQTVPFDEQDKLVGEIFCRIVVQINLKL